MNGHKVTMLGTGLIGLFYTRTLHGQRNRDRVEVVYSRSQERADAFARENGVPQTSTDLEAAIASAQRRLDASIWSDCAASRSSRSCADARNDVSLRAVRVESEPISQSSSCLDN